MGCLVLLIISLLYAMTTAQAADCNFKEFLKCSTLVRKIQIKDGCLSTDSDVETAFDCVKDLYTSCDFPSDDCDETFNCLLPETMAQAPMSLSYPNPCRVMGTIDACNKDNCQSGTVMKNDPDDCSTKAAEKCTKSVADVTQVNKDTCIDMGAAKNCFRDGLDYCGGNSLDFFAADLIGNGMARHIKQCKEQGYGFTKDGGICAPNPVDALVPDELLSLNIDSFDATKEICQKANKAKFDLENYLKDCKVTKYNEYLVKSFHERHPLVPMHEQCTKAGYTGMGGGVSSLAPHCMSAIVVVLLILVIQA